MLPKIDQLRSKRLLLEVRKEHHADELYDLFCEKDLYDYTMREIPPSKEWLNNGFKIAETLTSEDKKQIWLGWVGKKLETLSPIGLFEMTIENGEAFVAYTVFKKFWRQGYAIEGTQAMLNYSASIKIYALIINREKAGMISSGLSFALILMIVPKSMSMARPADEKIKSGIYISPTNCPAPPRISSMPVSFLNLERL